MNYLIVKHLNQSIVKMNYFTSSTCGVLPKHMCHPTLKTLALFALGKIVMLCPRFKISRAPPITSIAPIFRLLLDRLPRSLHLHQSFVFHELPSFTFVSLEFLSLVVVGS